jgi:hypothetical protein
MTRIEIPGGMYCDALPNGAYVCIRASGQPLVTHLGEVPSPAGANPLYVRCTEVGGWKFAGQSNHNPETLEYRDGGWHPVPIVACGVSPVIYDLTGQLHISDCGPSVGSQGWRYVDSVTGALVTGDATYGSSFGLSEWTDIGGGWYIGQCNLARGCACWDGTTLRMIEPGDSWFIRARRDGDQVSIALVRKTGDPSILRWLTMAELRAMPVVVPDPVVVNVPPINRALWFGGFAFGTPLAVLGNCLLAVRNITGPQARPVIVSDETVGNVSGTILGHFISGSTVEAIELQAKTIAERPVAYWDDRRWPRWPVLPTGAWLCVRAYCLKDESPAAFEADMRTVLSTVPVGQDVALVAQCYTSNLDLTSDLVGLVPVFARLCRDFPCIVALLPFSFSGLTTGRATGLQDHPEALPAWTALAATVTTPTLPIGPPPPPPPPKEPPMPALPVSPDIWQNVEYPQVLAARLARVAREKLDWQETTQWAIFQTMVRYGLAGVSDTNRVLVPVALATMIKNEDPNAPEAP